jgi:hypothetical protein
MRPAGQKPAFQTVLLFQSSFLQPRISLCAG